MSDLKHATDQELVREIQSSTSRIRQLEIKKTAQEQDLAVTKSKINNIQVRREWAFKYLSGEAR